MVIKERYRKTSPGHSVRSFGCEEHYLKKKKAGWGGEGKERIEPSIYTAEQRSPFSRRSPEQVLSAISMPMNPRFQVVHSQTGGRPGPSL